MTVARKPGHRGEHDISRNPPRRESRIASAEPVCSCAFVCAFLHTRPRVQRAPGFPCALLLLERVERRKARAHRAARMRTYILSLFDNRICISESPSPVVCRTVGMEESRTIFTNQAPL